MKIFTTYYADVLAMRKVFDSKVVKYLEGVIQLESDILGDIIE